MKRKKWLCALLGVSLFGMVAVADAKPNAKVSQEDPPMLELVATSDYQWKGVAASPAGRIFVSFPTWERHPSYHVGELVKGAVVPFDALETQATLINVESVVADATNTLWVLDSARLPGKDVDPSGAKLFMFDLSSNTLARTYVLPSDVVLSDSRMNDVRVDTARGFAFITDSGHGGIIVLDLNSGDAWRALTDISEVRAVLQGIYFQHTGFFNKLGNSDGLELSADKKNLFFSATGSDILYAVPTDVLIAPGLTVADRKKAIRVVNVKNRPTDGMVLRRAKLYMGNLSDEGVWQFDLEEANTADAGATMNLGVDIRWASSFALAPDGSIYFTTSAINYPVDRQAPYELFRLVWDKTKDAPQTFQEMSY